MRCRRGAWIRANRHWRLNELESSKQERWYAMSEILLNGMPFDAYLEKYKIFEKTMQFMMEYLKNWYDDDPEDFQKEMWADYRTVAETYQFKWKIAAIEKNYMYDSPLLCSAFSMDIYDDEGSYVAIYTAIFDLNGNCIDDLMR